MKAPKTTAIRKPLANKELPVANKELPVMRFEVGEGFRQWLVKNHDQSSGIYLHFSKKNSGEKSITYAEALDQALCYGWIDGQVKPFDEKSWLQKYTRRRPKSGWSKLNTQHVERLIESGAMTEAGLKAVEAAKADGRWASAYDSSRNANPPADFLKELAKNKKAHAFFQTLNQANLYAIVYRLQTAKKPETRQKRMKTILAMLADGKKYH